MKLTITIDLPDEGHKTLKEALDALEDCDLVDIVRKMPLVAGTEMLVHADACIIGTVRIDDPFGYRAGMEKSTTTEELPETPPRS